MLFPFDSNNKPIGKGVAGEFINESNEYVFSYVKTQLPSNATNLVVQVQIYDFKGQDKYKGNGENINIDGFATYVLTEGEYKLLETLSSNEIENMYGFIKGTKSVKNPDLSVLVEKEIKSNIKLIDELRSLPNGIYDEITSEGKYIKRINYIPNVTKGEIINYDDMANGGVFLIYNSSGNYQIGIKGDKANFTGSLIYQLKDPIITDITGFKFLQSYNDSIVYIKSDSDVLPEISLTYPTRNQNAIVSLFIAMICTFIVLCYIYFSIKKNKSPLKNILLFFKKMHEEIYSSSTEDNCYVINNKIVFLNLLFLIVLFLLVYYRSPYILKCGRFWAEEASVYFKYAFENSWLDTIFYVYKRAGYMYLSANLNALIASRLASLELAPLVTTYGSAIILFTLFALVLFSNSYVFKTLKERYLVCLVFLLAPTFISEVWLNSINTQVYFGLIAIVLLFINYKKSGFVFKVFTKFLIILSGLSGLYACVLTPFFIGKSIYTKVKEDIINAILLSMCSLIQLLIVIHSKLTGALASTKLSTLPDVYFLGRVSLNNILIPIFGRKNAIKIGNLIGLNSKALSMGTENLTPIIIGSIIIFSLLLIIMIMSKKYLPLYIFFIFMSISLFTHVGAHGIVGGRYSATAGALCLLILLTILYKSKVNKVKYIAGLLVIISLISGIRDYKAPFNAKYLYPPEGCPTWSEEIRKWEKDPNHKLQVWPYPRWKFKLIRKGEN